MTLEEKVARDICDYLVGIEHLIEKLPLKNKLMFSASIIQHSDGDFVSFDLVGRDSEEAVFKYHNVTIDKNTNTVVRSSDFVAENLKMQVRKGETK